ncbi:MAG TPA: MFS transporter [Acidimicrobiales bacterium]|nr:MFS transporter [Acidimicrobiales bacterium]
MKHLPRPGRRHSVPARSRRAPKPERAPLPRGFGTIWSTVAIDLVGFGIIIPVLPLYAERFGASPAVVGALFATFSVAQLLLAPVWGAVSDRMGRKPVLVLSLAGTAVGSLLTGLAGSLPLLFAGRLLDGASGASVSVAQAAVADVAEPGERARLFGLLGAAFGLGFVAGPALGALSALGGARVPFLVAAALAGVNALVAVRRLPETNARTVAAPFDRPPLAVADGLGAEGLGGLDPGAAVDPEPLGAPGREVGRLLGVAFGALVAFSAFEATFALFGERRLGFRPASTGAVFTVVGLALALVEGVLVHPTVHRFGELGTLRVGLACNAVGLLLLAAVRSWWALVPALLALVLGQGLATPSLTAAVAGGAAAHRRGGVLGLQQSAGGLARVVGPVAGGLAFEHLGVPSPYLLGAAAMVACALLVPR